MATFSLKRPRKQKLSPTTPPTWGQLKTFTQRVERVLEMTRSTKIPEHLFLAMLAVVTCASAYGFHPSSPGPYGGLDPGYCALKKRVSAQNLHHRVLWQWLF
ncbi:periphilin-1-like isoform X3 [Zalophus californianus]|uniref:Periphilin-1-like isoform X3 n=1 Tax=Zalophus californianus TaxID=9704 RepID=A0A6J2EAG8_ZALCA|nr:periphilin-1-like isoform X3 [Zalophus californianus]